MLTASASAATLIVTKIADTNDGVCNSDCSLREAIAAANSGDTVQVGFSAQQTISLTHGDTPSQRSLVINKNLTINGHGTLTISAGGVGWRIFNILGAGVVVTLNDMTISDASTHPWPDVPLRFNGAGINANSGVTLNINYCRIRNNRAVLGGGIYVDGLSTVNLNNSEVSGNLTDVNSTTSSGAGIHNEGRLNITNSIITDNQNDANTSLLAGGILNVGTLVINNSTIKNNTTIARSENRGQNGAGIINEGTLEMTNSTVTGNFNINSGNGFPNTQNAGGILARNNTVITNSTITDNAASPNSENSASGIYRESTNGTVTIRNTVVAANRNNANFPDTLGAFASSGYNFVGNRGAATGFGAAGDQLGTSAAVIDPLLQPLGYLGGDTQTHAVKHNSPLVDKGHSFGSITDQSGHARVADHPLINNAGDGTDIGAFELPLPRYVTKLADTNDGVCDAADCSLREAIATVDEGGVIFFVSPLFDSPRNILLSTEHGTLNIPRAITIQGRGANMLTIRPEFGTFGIFRLNRDAVSLNGMTIANGNTVDIGGGGIRAIGTRLSLNVTDCNITNNEGSYGGAILIGSDVTVNITGSTLSNNTARFTGAPSGGAIHNNGTLTITNSTLSGNQDIGSSNSGGAIWTATGATIESSTITNNEVFGTGGAGGIVQSGTGGAVVIRNSIIAGNRNNTTYPDTLAPVNMMESQGFNLIGARHSSTVFIQPGDQSGSLAAPLNPLLQPLASSNGPTLTHTPAINSTALDRGHSFGSKKDQRNRTRPVDLPSITNAIGSDGSDIGAFERRVTEQNTAPIANNDNYAVSKNHTLVSALNGVLQNDTDADGDTLTPRVVTTPPSGTVTFRGGGAFTYVPNPGFAGQDSFTYVANDGASDSNIATVTINVINDAPVAVADSYTTTRNTLLTVPGPGMLANDTDPNNDALTTAIRVTNPSHGGLDFYPNGAFAYLPNPGFTGTDSFTYKTNDGSLDSNVTTVSINVTSGGAITQMVNKTADTDDGVCDADCSLREAIAVALPGDSVGFTSPLFDTPQTIALSDSFRDLVVTKSLTINGRGAQMLTIRPQFEGYRVFNINGAGVTVNLNNLTVSHGSHDTNGGAINANGGVILNINNSHVTQSTASQGGAIYVTSDSFININGSTISNSTATGSTRGSGGLYTLGTTTIVNSTITGNRKMNGSSNGGGIFTRGPITITNSTITNNITAGTNSASGVMREGADSATIRGSIIAGNQGNTTMPDVGTMSAVYTGGSYNLFGNAGATTGFANAVDNNQIGTLAAPLDPQIDALAVNGGSTPTHRPRQGSTVIDKGNGFSITTDQRSLPRPNDNPTVSNASDGSDIGAVEYNTSWLVTKTADTNDGVCNNDCSLREAIAIAGTGDTIEFAPIFNYPQTITLSDAAGFQTLRINNKHLTIAGKGAHMLTVRRNPASSVLFGVFSISNSANVTLSGMTITGGRIPRGGGGVFVPGAKATINACNITGNTTVIGDTIAGGGIASGNDSSLTVINSTVWGNAVEGTNANESAGGIKAGGAEFILVNSTVSGNSASGTFNAGGVYLTANSSIITNSTISDNVVSGTNSTGGVYGIGDNTFVRNTIVAGNRGPAGTFDIDTFTGPFNSMGYNVIGATRFDAGFVNEMNNDQVGSSFTRLDARLAPLAMNGGAGPTHALLTGSPAIGMGTSNGAPALDQRGAARSGAVDVGAYEVNASHFVVLPNATLNMEYNQTLVHNTGSATFATGGVLPSGMSLNTNALAPSATLSLSGTPNIPGVYNFSLQTTVGGNTSTTNYQLLVLAPTSVHAGISGRILTADGRPISNVTVMLNGGALVAPRHAVTGHLGYYHFEDVPVGVSYVVSISSKRFTFADGVKLITLQENLTDLDFIAEPNQR